MNVAGPLPTVGEPPEHYRLEVPVGDTPWITENNRYHWGARHRLVKHYRRLGQVLALHNQVPRIELAHVVCELRFADRRRRDPHNWMPTAKAVVDGMVDAGVFIDDNHSHVIGPDMRIGPVDAKPLLIMHIFPRRT